MPRLEFFFDIVCPYAMLAATRIEALAQRTGHELVLRPVLLGGIYRAVNNADHPSATWAENKQLMTWRDLHRQAELLDMPLRFPDSHPRRTVEAMRLLCLLDQPQMAELMHALFQAYWIDNRDVSDRAVLEEIASAHDVDAALMDSPEAREKLRENTAEAVARGAFGVPTFMQGERLWWGVDRMHFLEADLGGEPEAYTPRPSTPARLEVFHDFSSPFSCLGCLEIENIAREHGAELAWRPMLLGALFRNIGTPMMPMLEMNEARRNWGAEDLARWARERGFDFRFTSHFPLNTVLALRCSNIAPALIPAFYRAAWSENRNLSEEDVIREIITEQGLDADEVIEQALAQANKDAIRANTERAEAIGACGAPTFVVNDQYAFWGQDRLEMVRRALDGWQPAIDRELAAVK